ncbi:SRPBCC family protein [Mumia zhuanghuii]|uniref:SRPBCC family protein n=2 Tax=Mumia TaxID=1546255 RepID=A0ABW1QP85_9ACTN|nr:MULTISPECIES: SRPBCC family protein [Mumia]KAA1423759.1 SRPBCC family protein [Mumia zhuanghuii]
MPTPTADPYFLEVSTDVAASPRAVWTAVSDLRRMPEWSPQTRRMVVLGRTAVGTRTINVNRLGWKVWPSTSKVVRYEPQRAISFLVPVNGMVWTYEIEDLGDGTTRIVERREAPKGSTSISKVLIKRFLGGHEGYSARLEQDMAATLARIKAAAELDA